MPEKVEILVELKNDQDVKRRLQDIQGICDKLSKGVTVSIKADTSNITRAVQSVKATLSDISRPHTVGMSNTEIANTAHALSGVQQTLNDIERPRTITINTSQIGSIMNTPTAINAAEALGLPSVFDKEIRSWLQAAYGLDKQLPALSYDFYKQIVPNFVMQGSPYPTYAGYGFQPPATLDALEVEWHEVEAAAESAQEVSNRPIAPDTSGLDRVNTELETAKENVVSLRDILGGIGGAFNTVGGFLTGMGNLFHFDLLGTVSRTLTAYGTVLGTQGFSKAISRYDIMSTYGDYMELMGVSAEKADASLEKINENIQGIPVGLDQAAQEIRMFTMYLSGTEDSMDDVADKATDLAIGLEKALVAGGAAEYMQTTARYEINRLLATGSLATSRQWQALLNGLGISSAYLRKAMGYGDLSNREFISRLSLKDDDENKITSEEFIEGIAKLADYEDLNDAIEVYKATISAWINNIGFSLARGFENVFKAINEVLGGKDMGIIGNMEKIRNQINEIFLAASDWIKQNPELITTFVDKIGDIFQRIKELDIGQLALDIVENGGKVVDFLLKLSRIFPDSWIRNFIAFSVTWASPLGRIFRLIGTFFVTLSKIPANGGLLGRILGGAFGTRTDTGGGVITGNGLLGMFGTIAAIASMGGVIYEYAKVLESISKLDFGDNLHDNLGVILTSVSVMGGVVLAFSKFFSGLGSEVQLGLLAGEGLTLGLEALIAGGGGIIYEFAKIGEYVSGIDLTNFNANMAVLDNVLTQVAGFVLGGTAVGTAAFAATGGIGALAMAIGEALTAGVIGDIDLAIDAIKRCAEMAEIVSDMKISDDTEKKIERLGNMLTTLFNTLPTLTDEDINASGYSSAFFDNMANALGSMKTAADNLASIEGQLNWLNRREGKFEEIKSKVTEFALGVGDVYQAFVDGFGPSWLAKVKSKNYEETLGNMNNAMTELTELANAMSNMEYTLDTLQLGISGKTQDVEHEVLTKTGRSSRSSSTVSYTTKEWIPDNFQKYVDRITEFVEGMDGIFDILGKSPWAAVAENAESSAQANALSAMHSALKTIAAMLTSMKNLKDSLRETDKLPWNYMIDFVNRLFSLFGTSGFQNFTFMSNAPQMAENFQNAALAFGGKNGSGGIVAIVRALRGLVDPLQVVEDEDIPNRISQVFNSIESIFVGSWAVDEGDGRDLLSKSENAKGAINNIRDIIKDLSSIKDDVNGLFSEDTNFGNKIGELMNSLFSSFDSENAEGFSTRIGEMQAMIQSVVDLFAALAESDISGLNEQVQHLIDMLSNQLNPYMEQLKDIMGDAKSEAGMLAGNIQSVGVMAGMASGHITTLQTNLSGIISTLNSATTAAGALASALGSIPTNLNISASVSRVNSLFPNGGRGGGNRRVLYATGGPVGTDTIPAWLSPGEFVMRAKAVRTFGEVFMRNVNQLNIPGAVNALAKQYAFNNPTSNSYVNNYDNHASVNQTIITNNADYSYKRASRFVRALH